MAKRTCAVDGCENPSRTRGWCVKHYTRWKRTGTTDGRIVIGTCTVEGCKQSRSALGWCERHYQRWLRSGTTDQPPRPTAEHRFWAKVDRNEPGGCWLWVGALADTGYGTFWVSPERRKIGAHRFSYELNVGPVPPGLELDHLCKVPRCVNPDHLEPVDRAENNRRSDSFSAVNARKTHCIRGHLLDEANTYVPPNKNERHCRACKRLLQGEYMDRKRARMAVVASDL